jgi:hypothetical protein
MDEQDKIYLWMVIATFAALAIGILFSVLHTNEIIGTTIQALNFP